jgi:NDP-sugar pyrophosphorylase family protein
MAESASVLGIVIAGAYPARQSALDALAPRPLLPIAQQPLVTYALRWMSEGGLEHATICANSAARALRARVDAAALAMRLRYREDWNPRGTAGCVRDAGTRSEAGTFVVADGTAVPVVDIGEVVESHRASGALLTVVVAADTSGRLAPTGVYVFDRRAFEHIPAEGFQDIKERLLPKLYAAGEEVGTFVAPSGAPRVVNTDSYMALDHWAVSRLSARDAAVRRLKVQGDAFVHESASVDPTARLLGPVLVGAGVSVAAEATLVGPLSLGPGTQVGRGAVVSRTVAWSGCSIGEEALVDRCMLADGASVEARQPLFATVRTGERLERAGKTGRALWQPIVEAFRPAPANAH